MTRAASDYTNYPIERSILKTLAYADVFQWPLSLQELRFKLQDLRIENADLSPELEKLIQKRKIERKNNLYFLFGKEFLVKKRLEREKWKEQKLKIAKKVASWLKVIPSILLAGVSGGLAVGNVSQDDDIDFFIICRRKTLWTTRFLATLLLDLMGKRRQPGSRFFKDKICLNMFVDEDGMVVPAKERDLYTAHEVIQMRPLWDRGVCHKFMTVNDWVVNYLPNFKFQSASWRINFKSISNIRCQISKKNHSIIEKILCWLQLKIMRRKTREKIEPHRLLFHPEDKRKWVMKEFHEKLKLLKL